MRDKILLYSGGMDSTVLLHQYSDSIRLAVCFQYGSKHNHQEKKYAELNCKKLGVEFKVVNIDLVGMGLESSLLTSGDKIPHGHYTHKSMISTVVPFRNGIMLSIAAGIAETLNCKSILISNHAGDHAIYPDCREGFISAISSAISNGTYNNINVIAPFTNDTKRDVAIIGKGIGVDFSNTYSCYEGMESHCGKCGTCIERKEALEGFDDTVYA